MAPPAERNTHRRGAMQSTTNNRQANCLHLNGQLAIWWELANNRRPGSQEASLDRRTGGRAEGLPNPLALSLSLTLGRALCGAAAA